MLSMMVGLIADIDLNSEKLRSWGDIRFDIYAVLNICRKKCYRIRVEIFDKDEKLISDTTGELNQIIYLYFRWVCIAKQFVTDFNMLRLSVEK